MKLQLEKHQSSHTSCTLWITRSQILFLSMWAPSAVTQHLLCLKCYTLKKPAFQQKAACSLLQSSMGLISFCRNPCSPPSSPTRQWALCFYIICWLKVVSGSSFSEPSFDSLSAPAEVLSPTNKTWPTSSSKQNTHPSVIAVCSLHLPWEIFNFSFQLGLLVFKLQRAK